MDSSDMKKILLSLLLLAAACAHADPYDVTVRQRNSADTGYLDRFIKFPVSGDSCLFSLDGPSILPACYTLGTGLSLASGVVSATAAAQVNADWAASSGVAQVLNKPTTRAGYGITDALGSSDLAPYATTASVTSSLSTKADTSALTSGLAAKQNTLSLTVTGSGAASLVGATLNIPTPATATPFNFSQPTARTLAVSTSYQALDNTKAAVIYPSYACQNATQVLASSACTVQVRMGTGTLTCSTGTVYYTQSLSVSLGVLLTQNSTNPVPINLPIGGSFILCATAGTFTTTTVEQTAG